MATPEERKAAFIESLAPRWSGLVHNQDDGRDTAEKIWNDIISHYEETDDFLADLIRLGFNDDAVEASFQACRRGIATEVCIVDLIDYPDGAKPEHT